MIIQESDTWVSITEGLEEGSDLIILESDTWVSVTVTEGLGGGGGVI